MFSLGDAVFDYIFASASVFLGSPPPHIAQIPAFTAQLDAPQDAITRVVLLRREDLEQLAPPRQAILRECYRLVDVVENSHLVTAVDRRLGSP